MESSYQKFAKGVLIIGITNVLVVLGGVILLLLITKTLGAHDYGIWVQVQVTVMLVMNFTGLGLPGALSRFLPSKSDKGEIQDEFYSVLILTSLFTAFISFLLFFFSDLIGSLFFGSATEIVKLTALIALVWSIDMTLLSFFRAFSQMRKYAIFIIIQVCGEIGVIVYLVLNGHGIFAVVLSSLAVKTVLLFALLFLFKLQLGIKRPHFFRMKEYLSFGLPTVPSGIAQWAVASSDRYVIAYFLGATSVGIYSGGYEIGSAPRIVAVILAFALLPALSKLYDEGKINEAKTLLSYSLKYFLSLAIPFIFGTAILAEPVLRLFSTTEIASKGHVIVPLVALGILFYGAYMVIAHVLVVAKKTKTIGLIWIITAAVNLGLNIVAVPYLGILGAALTTLIAYGLALGLTTYYSFKEFKFPIDWHFIIKSLGASVIMSIAIWKMAPQGTSATILTVVAGTVIYGIALFLLRGFNEEELRFFRELFPKG